LIPISKPLIGEEEQEAVADVLASGHLAQGPNVAEFERAFADYLGVKYAVATSSGTTALHLALLAHGIGPGDEVITSPFTFIASANSVLFVGARPVFADIEEDGFNIDPALIEERITERTKAIMPVHLYGNPADMARIMGIAKRYGLLVIEDAAQAHGAMIGSRKVGTFGTGCFSFYATKNITCGEGGMITTNDDYVAGQARLLRQHGMRRRYYHEQLGYNFRMTDIQAAIGLAQLDKLEWFNQQRRSNAQYLDQHLKGVVTPRERPGTRHVWHQYTIRVPSDRDAAAKRLRDAGVGTGIYYPVPVHQQKVYRELGYNGIFPVAEQRCEEVLSLPVHPALTQGDMSTIVSGVNELVGA